MGETLSAQSVANPTPSATHFTTVFVGLLSIWVPTRRELDFPNAPPCFQVRGLVPRLATAHLRLTESQLQSKRSGIFTGEYLNRTSCTALMLWRPQGRETSRPSQPSLKLPVATSGSQSSSSHPTNFTKTWRKLSTHNLSEALHSDFFFTRS